jgi:hypothetical protein
MKTTIFILAIITSSLWSQELDTAWIVHSVGPDSMTDYPVAMAVDQSDNIIVTGVQFSNAGRRDIITLKYSPDGTLLWSSLYDGTAHRDDEPTHLCLDQYGYIYVAGQSRGLVGLAESRGTVILKYYPTGELTWAKRYDIENTSSLYVQGLAIDPKRNVISTMKLIEGSTLTMNELITRKLYSTGDLVWEKALPVHRWSECFGINIDSYGNIFLGGWLWQGAGNSDYEFFALAKYSVAGSLLWFSPFRDSTAWYANSEVFMNDSYGNYFAAGEIEKLTGEEVFATGKYDEDGGILWSREFLAAKDPEVIDIVADIDGNVLWLAKTENDTAYDIIITKYMSNGDFAWVRYFSNYSPFPVAIDVDDEGNVYTLSRAWVEEGLWGLLLIKLDPEGKTVWTIMDHEDRYRPVDIAIDHKKNVIVISSFNIKEGVDGTSYITTIKFSQLGVTSANLKSQGIVAKEYALDYNFPNPFNSNTIIKYSIPNLSQVKLVIFNLLGEEIKTLVNEYKPAGNYEIEFNSHSGEVRNLPSGVYFYQLRAGNFVETKKMLLLK